MFLLLAAFAAAMMPLGASRRRKAQGTAAAVMSTQLSRGKMVLTMLLWSCSSTPCKRTMGRRRLHRPTLGHRRCCHRPLFAVSSVLGFAGALVPSLAGNGPSRLPNISLASRSWPFSLRLFSISEAARPFCSARSASTSDSHRHALSDGPAHGRRPRWCPSPARPDRGAHWSNHRKLPRGQRSRYLRR